MTFVIKCEKNALATAKYGAFFVLPLCLKIYVLTQMWSFNPCAREYCAIHNSIGLEGFDMRKYYYNTYI